MSRTSLEDQEPSQPQHQEQPQQPQERRIQNQRQLHRRQQQHQRCRGQGARNQRKKYQYPYNPPDPARLALDELRTLDYRMVPNEHYFIDERGNRRLVPKFPSSALDSDPVDRTRRELQMEWQRRVLQACIAGG